MQPIRRWRIVIDTYLRQETVLGKARPPRCKTVAEVNQKVYRTDIVILEIVILAMIAAFLGLRLYSVLGQRAEHEEESIPQRFDAGENANPGAAAPQATPAMPQRAIELEGVMPAVERGIREIADADRNFAVGGFVVGAKAAYEMVLEAFWKGDRDTLRELCDDDVYEGFTAAIDAREASGHSLDNKLIRIEETRIHSASLDGRIARIAVLFIADIAAVTRDKDGNVVAGSLDDAIESRDIWTFSRNVGAGDPNWLLDETDEG
jgi:predicted lipid-binding transport protein (Tim44 family)